MAQYIFQTDGNYVNFNGGGGLWRLARASNCIAWRFDETGDLFFDVYDQQYVVKAENIAQVVIDGVPLAAASDFPNVITAVFTGLGSSSSSSYLVYTALISQTGTNAPTEKLLEDTIGGSPIYGYDSQGVFRLTNTGKFTLNKTSVDISNPGYYSVGGGINDVDSIYIQSNNPDGSPVNSVFSDTKIEIRVYP